MADSLHKNFIQGNDPEPDSTGNDAPAAPQVTGKKTPALTSSRSQELMCLSVVSPDDWIQMLHPVTSEISLSRRRRKRLEGKLLIWRLLRGR